MEKQALKSVKHYGACFFSTSPFFAAGLKVDPQKRLGLPLVLRGVVRDRWVLKCGEGCGEVYNLAAGNLAVARSESGLCYSPELE